MTPDECARCGQRGHLPKDCSWPTDTQDEPNPPPAPPVEPEPDAYDFFTM